MSRTVIISPAFHGYWRSIAEAIQRRGHQTTTVRYDAYDTMREKLRLKTAVELPERLGRGQAARRAENDRVTQRVIAVVREVRPDRVLVIKGDGLGPAFWEALGETPRILWLYDDLHRHDYTPAFLREVGPVVSYSRSEAQLLREEHGVRATFVPDAFDPHRRPLPHARSGLVAFVGAGYPNRCRILSDLAARGLPVRAWGRDFSRHPVDRARTWSWRRPAIAASRDVPLERAYEIVGEAACAVNIHGLQTGHSMRTFEIPGMGGVELVDRADVAEFYDIGTEVALWSSTEELADLARRALRDRTWSETLRREGRRRTLAEHTFDHRIAAIEELWEPWD